jgi:N-acetylglucosaminyldiphosphoundecaprenol N-acetyl-beta-D-mannosaminyltransferase
MINKFEQTPESRAGFGDFSIDCLTREQLALLVVSEDFGPSTKPKLLIDVNGHALSLAKTNREYREAIKAADFVHADGGFLVTLSKMLCRFPIPERSATTDLIHDVAKLSSSKHVSFYLLGGDIQTNNRCADILSQKYPKLQIVGRRDGFFSSEDESDVVNEINNLNPTVLWVGLGKPKEQIFSAKWKSEIRANWIVTCGGCFNYITGDYKRAPIWMQRLNIEWLHRMVTNPKKLAMRYLTTNPHALWISIREHR